MEPTTDLPHELINDSQRKWDEFTNAAKHANISLGDDSDFIKISKRVFAFSNFIAGSCTQNPAMLADLVQSGDLYGQFPTDHYHDELKKSLSSLYEKEQEDNLSSILRNFRLREMIRIAWRDLAGRADLSQTMADLSALAEACIHQALLLLYEWACHKYGIPTGYEFASFLEAILNVSSEVTGLSDKMKDQLKRIKKPVHIQVFVTPTCPYCTQAALMAYQLAIENENITADVVEITEFPHLAQKYNVMGVPKVVINENHFFEGALPEHLFIEHILNSVEEEK